VILSNSFEEIMFHFRELPVSVDHVRLWDVSVTQAQLERVLYVCVYRVYYCYY
jgi:hypothetical protein